jgi:hypothetical protein
MCTVLNCWYPKHAIFEIPPVINDPATLQDVRPDQTSGTETFIDNQVGLSTTFGTLHEKFGSCHKKFGSVDVPNYIGS